MAIFFNPNYVFGPDRDIRIKVLQPIKTSLKSGRIKVKNILLNILNSEKKIEVYYRPTVK